jgi:D-3-phosphoglycerate dehydrogenase / 2-oxoglutarate reductase
MQLLIADKFAAEFLSEFRALGLGVDYQPEVTAEGLVEAASGVHVLVVRSKKVTRAVIAKAPSLALIIRAGAGYDTIDVEAASERGIFVTNCPGKNSAAVAELTLGLLLALDRRIPENSAALAQGKWNKKDFSKADGIKGKTLGVIGTGSIGREVITRARAFDLKVVAWSRTLTEESAAHLGVERCATLDELAVVSDVVSVHLAQTVATKGMIGADFFAKMKKGAIFINTSRGGLVDTAALKSAMKEKGIRAALDVFEKEPAEGAADFSDELFTMKGFVGTHHIGASTDQAQNAIAAEAVRICREFVLTGQVPNVVNIKGHSAAHHQLIVRHYDKVGVLANVLGIIRNHGINVEEMNNTIFQGQKAAIAVLRLSVAASKSLVDEISRLREEVIFAEAKSG